MRLRDFSAEVEGLADIWSTAATTSDRWTPTEKQWQTNSKPLRVQNQNNIIGVAKPGQAINDGCLRAAHEKIVSDLAYVLALPVPPVTLWDRGEEFDGDARICAVSAWAFPHPIEWQHVRPTLSGAQLRRASAAAGAMQVFDTWIAASDRKANHILVNDDGSGDHLRLAYIDYAFALSYEWMGVAPRRPDPRPAWPDNLPVDRASVDEAAAAILNLPESDMREIIFRLPRECCDATAAGIILRSLLDRRACLRGWFGL